MSDEVLTRLTLALADRYRIDRELGAGGMATVYLAHDLKHDRQVAVKVLKPELGAVLGAERFLSEIKVTAHLQHPNLLPLFDSGAAGGLLYYVMPYIDGETLRARMERERQLPVDEVTRLVTLMAGALDHAHARGVIHRDLKPENILLQAGQPVIADFGIALAVQHAGGERVTQTGLSLGTPHYMSPEQAAGDRAVDARSDQYALGAVTYEMLTGEPPHTGATAQVIIARLMSETPRSMRTVRPAVSAALDEAVHRALAKTPADRFASCDDFARALVAGATATATTAATSPASASRFGLIAFGVILTALTVLGTVVWLTVRRNRPATSSLPVIGRTTQVTRDPGLEIDPALSRDGAMIAFAQGPATRMQIYVQQVTGGRRVALTSDSTDNFRSPQWSPDGTQIAYHGNDGIFVVASLGGEPRRITRLDAATSGGLGAESVAPINGLSWAPDGQRLAHIHSDSGLFIVPVNGGALVHVRAPGNISSPAWSPDGAWIALTTNNPLFTFGTGYLGNVGNSSIWIVPVAGGEAIRVTDDDQLNTSPKWSPDSRALYWISNRDGSRDIYRVNLDANGRAAASPDRLTTGVEAHGIDLSKDGSHLAYASFRTFSNIWSMAVPRVGPVSVATARAVTTGYQTIEMLDVSADGRWLVFDSDRNGNADIYRMPSTGGDATRLTTDSTGDFGPVWSPDGRQIAFHSLRAGTRDIYTMSADGTGVVQRTSWPTQELDAQWSPDGSMLGFEIYGDGANSPPTFRLVPLKEGESASRSLGGVGDFLAWSPTGTMSYHTAAGVRTLPGSGDSSRLIVDNARDGGTASLGVWSPDGRTLHYLTRRPTGWEIRAIPAQGGASRPLVKFDDDTRQPTRYGFATDGRMFYFTLGSNESDVWVMKLEKR